MDLEEAVSKGRCVVTLAQRQSWSHILPLSNLSTLFLLGDAAGASLCLEQRVSGGTLGVLASASPASQSDAEPPRVSRQAGCCALTPSGWVTLWL